MSASQQASDDGPAGPAYGDSIDQSTFEQILEMDDDDDRDFSKSIVYGFFEQAENTFGNMDDNLRKRDLNGLSQLGHFLKGSSATLGLTKVKDACEKIQNFGAKKDATGVQDETDEQVCLDNCRLEIATAKSEFSHVEKVLKKFYEGMEEQGS